MRYRIHHEIETDSTNEWAKRTVDIADGDVFCADTQTAGKGTYSRSFVSPKGGLYFSIALKDVPENKLENLTRLAAVAVAETVKKFGQDAKIKWVNDILIGNKKVCGILCENSTDRVIVGIGINVFPPEKGFDADIQGIATTLFDEPYSEEKKGLVLRSVLENFFALFDDFALTKLNELYTNYSCVLGKKISVTRGESSIVGVAKRFTEEGHLVVETESGEKICLSGTLRII